MQQCLSSVLNSGNEEENKEKVNTRPLYDRRAAARGLDC